MQTLDNSQKFTETQGFVDDSKLSKKEQRIREAVIMYYSQDMTQQEVADEIGVTRRTVAKYLDSDTAKGFERIFSDKEKYEIQRWLENQVAKHYDKAVEGLEKAKQRAENNPEASPQHLTNASLGLVRANKEIVGLMQELGVIDKKPDKVEKTESGPASVNVSMELAEAYEEKQEQEGVEADAEQ